MAPLTDPKNALTDRERELMALAWLCFSEKPKPDYKKLAALAGMTNPVSASNAWSKIQKKITAQAGDVSGDGTPEVQTPKATPGKKRAARPMGDDEESPAKKTRTPGKAKEKKGAAAVKVEAVEEDGGSGGAASGGNSEGEGEEENFF